MAAHVLIVDDDEGIRLALRMILEDASYNVDEASDGAVALRLITSSSDGMVILLDNLMPGLDAGELLTALEDGQRDGHDAECEEGHEEGHEDGATRHAFILVTASPQRITPALAAHLARLGAPVVAKPFDLSTVLGVIASAVVRLDQHEEDESGRSIAAGGEESGDGAKPH